MRLKSFLMILLCTLPLFAIEQVSVQLKWHHQFQFAGYYAAIEQGYYRNEGLEVTLKDRDTALNNVDQVLNGKSGYGIADTVLLLYQAQKKPVVIVAPIFQHSPNVLITLASSGIDSPEKLIGKRVAFYPNDADGLPTLAMLYETGVVKRGFKRVPTQFDIKELYNKQVDATHGYATNEPYAFRQKGFEVNVLYPQNFGVDFYGDILFTTHNELEHHPKRVAAMKRATIKGWQYAIAHKEEIIRLIQTKYHSTQTTQKLLFEADGVIAAIAPSSIPIGTLNQGRLEYIHAMLKRHGLIDSPVSLEHYIYRDAQGLRLAVLEYISLDQMLAMGSIFVIILITLVYYMRQLRKRRQELIGLSDSLNQAQSIAHLGNWEWDIQKNTLWWSDEIYRIFGFKPQEFSPTYDLFLTQVHPDDRIMVQEAVSNALNDEALYHCVHRIVLPDKMLRYILEEGVVQYDDHQNPIKMMGTVHDITERKKVEILLAEKEGSLQTLLNSVAEGIYGVDVNGYCTFVNRSFLRILKFEHENQILGKHIHELIHHSHKDGSVYPSPECKMYKANKTHLASHVDDEVFWCQDGTSVAVEYWSYPMLENGEFVGAVATFLDITERIAAREQLIKAKESAEASTRSKSEFLAAMSHEIRTPMNGVLGMLGLLEQSNLDTTQKHQVRVATSSATSLLGLINDILDFSKIEAGKMTLENIQFNLHDELKELTEAIAFKAHEKGLQLLLNIMDIKHQNIIADPGRLRQILTNLVSNAIKFTHQGTIAIDVFINEIDENHGLLHIDVIDSGIGIPADKIRILFDAFTQADGSTTRKYGGTGLGLSIVKQLCELMEGSISVASIPNEGSTFSIDLRVEFGNNERISTKRPSPIHSDDKVLWPVHTRILLVEDNPTNQMVAQAMLETMGLSADIATNGHEAIESIKHASNIFPYSIILMDCQMPDMDGYDATRGIRSGKAGEKNTQIPIIAMTANAMSGDREKCMIAGMDDYIAKPINTVTLKQTLIKWLFNQEIQTLTTVQNESQLAQLKVVLWDEQEALARMGGNRELLIKIIRSFLLDSNNSLNALRTAIEDENTNDAQLHAHSIKGAAGNVGALKLQAIAKTLEDAAHKKNLVVLKEAFPECEAILKATQHLLEEYVAREIQPTKEKKHLDPPKMVIALQSLKNDLESGTFIDTDTMELFTESSDTDMNTKLDGLRNFVERFENQQAIEVIETIMSELERY